MQRNPHVPFIAKISTLLLVAALGACESSSSKSGKATKPESTDVRQESLQGLWHTDFVDEESNTPYEILIRADENYVLSGKWCQFGSFDHPFDAGIQIEANGEANTDISPFTSVNYQFEVNGDNLDLITAFYDIQGVLQNTDVTTYDRISDIPQSCALKDLERQMYNLSPSSAVRGEAINIEFDYKYRLVTTEPAIVEAQITIDNETQIDTFSNHTLESTPDTFGNIVEGFAELRVEPPSIVDATAVKVCFSLTLNPLFEAHSYLTCDTIQIIE